MKRVLFLATAVVGLIVSCKPGNYQDETIGSKTFASSAKCEVSWQVATPTQMNLGSKAIQIDPSLVNSPFRTGRNCVGDILIDGEFAGDFSRFGADELDLIPILKRPMTSLPVVNEVREYRGVLMPIKVTYNDSTSETKPMLYVSYNGYLMLIKKEIADWSSVQSLKISGSYKEKK